MKETQIHIIPSKKFKTITIVGKFMAALKRDTVTKRALLPYVFEQGTKNYPSERALNLKLDSLYGAVFTVNSSKSGENHIISFRLEVANEKYIENESTIMDEALSLLREVIYSPRLADDVFPEEIINREKETLTQKIHAIYDDKITYANRRLIDNMCEGEDFAIHSTGYIEDLAVINNENLYAYYEQMLLEDRFDLYVLGDFKEAEMREKVCAIFADKVHHQAVRKQVVHKNVTEVKEIIERQDIQQAKLHLGYRTNCVFGSDDYFALQVFNGLFGGFPSSKLFINVREKNSLAYYVASRLESQQELMFVFSGIASEAFEQAKTIINEQFLAMQQGDFTDEEVAATKELVISQILETEDSASGAIELAYQQVIGGTNISSEKLIENIEKVTKADCVRIAKKIELDTIYLLTDESGGENA